MKAWASVGQGTIGVDGGVVSDGLGYSDEAYTGIVGNKITDDSLTECSCM